MNEQSFQAYYQHLTDDQLRDVLADKQDLVPEAASALDAEVQRRKLGPPEPPRWKPLPDTNRPVCSLEDFPSYRDLTAKRRFANRYAVLIAIAPLSLGLAFAKQKLENSIVFLFLSLGWAFVVAAYALSAVTRWLGFRCPQCGESFGRGAECFSCGFPRNESKNQA